MVKSCPADRDLDRYNKCLQKFVETNAYLLPEGVPDIKLPEIDPFRYDIWTWNYNFSMFSITANMSDILIKRASGYKLAKLYANPFNLTQLRLIFWFHTPSCKEITWSRETFWVYHWIVMVNFLEIFVSYSSKNKS